MQEFYKRHGISCILTADATKYMGVSLSRIVPLGCAEQFGLRRLELLTSIFAARGSVPAGAYLPDAVKMLVDSVISAPRVWDLRGSP